jgi:hypothetical protein
MATTYTDYEHNYWFYATEGPATGRHLAVKVTEFASSIGGWNESDLDKAFQAFTDSLNESALVKIDKVEKAILASAVSDWTYRPTV